MLYAKEGGERKERELDSGEGEEWESVKGTALAILLVLARITSLSHTHIHTHDDSRLQRAGKSMLDVNRVRLKRERALERA